MSKRGHVYRPPHAMSKRGRVPPVVIPNVGPATRRVDSYPLGDYLYDRAKAAHDLTMANLRWQDYKLRLPADERAEIEKVERIFRKNAIDRIA
jgi:hypothetical protein